MIRLTVGTLPYLDTEGRTDGRTSAKPCNRGLNSVFKKILRLKRDTPTDRQNANKSGLFLRRENSLKKSQRNIFAALLIIRFIFKPKCSVRETHKIVEC